MHLVNGLQRYHSVYRPIPLGVYRQLSDSSFRLTMITWLYGSSDAGEKFSVYRSQ